jgi:phage recombination protein Bet
MSQSLVSRNGSQVASAQGAQFTPEQLQLIRDTIAKGATPDELKLFLYRCQNMGLDPLKPGQIHFVKYGSSPGTIVVGIEGFRSIAGRTGQMAGVKRGVIKDANGKLVGAWAEVYRKDWTAPAREEVPFSEYNTGKGPWAKMPETMLKKVAEAAALRMAFPDSLGGIFENAEMDQAAAALPEVRPMQPEPGDGNTEPTEYRIGFGQWKGKSIEQAYRDFGPQKMVAYMDYLEDSAKKKGQPLGDQAAEFIRHCGDYLGAVENSHAAAMRGEPTFGDEP